MVNQSKANDLRFWKKWQDSGAARTIEKISPLNRTYTWPEGVELVLDFKPCEDSVTLKSGAVYVYSPRVHAIFELNTSYLRGAKLGDGLNLISYYVAGALGQRGHRQEEYLTGVVESACAQLYKILPTIPPQDRPTIREELRKLTRQKNMQIKEMMSGRETKRSSFSRT